MIQHRHAPLPTTLLFIVAILSNLLTYMEPAFSTTDPAATSAPEITRVNGNLYRFVDQNRSGVFLVTGSGIIVGDPPDSEAAIRLKTELASRFNQTIKYVFYSRFTANRASGADALHRSGAIIIAHQNSPTTVEGSTASPTIVFSEQLTIRLGDSTVDLHYPGKSLTDDLIIAHFPAERAVFAADIVSVERLPLQDLSDGFFPEWFMAIDRMNRLDYVYLIPGSGKIGIRTDAIEHGYYLRELHHRVRRGVESGMTEAELLQSLKLDRYQQWEYYQSQLPLNISGLYQVLTR